MLTRQTNRQWCQDLSLKCEPVQLRLKKIRIFVRVAFLRACEVTGAILGFLPRCSDYRDPAFKSGRSLRARLARPRLPFAWHAVVAKISLPSSWRRTKEPNTHDDDDGQHYFLSLINGTASQVSTFPSVPLLTTRCCVAVCCTGSMRPMPVRRASVSNVRMAASSEVTVPDLLKQTEQLKILSTVSSGLRNLVVLAPPRNIDIFMILHTRRDRSLRREKAALRRLNMSVHGPILNEKFSCGRLRLSSPYHRTSASWHRPHLAGPL